MKASLIAGLLLIAAGVFLILRPPQYASEQSVVKLGGRDGPRRRHRAARRRALQTLITPKRHNQRRNRTPPADGKFFPNRWRARCNAAKLPQAPNFGGWRRPALTAGMQAG